MKVLMYYNKLEKDSIIEFINSISLMLGKKVASIENSDFENKASKVISRVTDDGGYNIEVNVKTEFFEEFLDWINEFVEICVPFYNKILYFVKDSYFMKKWMVKTGNYPELDNQGYKYIFKNPQYNLAFKDDNDLIRFMLGERDLNKFTITSVEDGKDITLEYVINEFIPSTKL